MKAGLLGECRSTVAEHALDLLSSSLLLVEAAHSWVSVSNLARQTIERLTAARRSVSDPPICGIHNLFNSLDILLRSKLRTKSRLLRLLAMVALMTVQGRSSDTLSLNKLIDLSEIEPIPTIYDSGAIFAIAEYGGTIVKTAVWSHGSDAFGISKGILLFEDSNRLFTLNLRTQAVTELLAGKTVHRAAWRPKTSSIAVLFDDERGRGLLVYDLASNHTEFVSHRPVRTDLLRWSKDGERLFFLLSDRAADHVSLVQKRFTGFTEQMRSITESDSNILGALDDEGLVAFVDGASGPVQNLLASLTSLPLTLDVGLITPSRFRGLARFRNIAIFAIERGETSTAIGEAIVALSLANSRIEAIQTGYPISSSPLAAEAGLVGAWYLSFPLAGQDSSTATINSIFDHSSTTAYNDDNVTVAYTGERGESRHGSRHVWGSHYGFKNASGTDFVVNGHYAGGGDAGSGDFKYLYYDGHPGFDYRAGAGTQLYASADGVIFDVQDSTNTFYIDHGNGYRSYYLHTGTSNGQGGWTRNNVTGTIKRGDPIAKVGGAGGFPPHLHFEVRRGSSPAVDPYGWQGGCHDPYTAAVSTNLWTNSGLRWDFNITGNFQGWTPTNVDCFAVAGGFFTIDPKGSGDPYMLSPPLVNVSASTYRTLHFRMASNGVDGNGAIYFTTDSSPAWGEDKRVDFTVNRDGAYRDYTINMSSHIKWIGTITGVRIDPASGGSAGNDTIGFDFIEITGGSGDTIPPAISLFSVTPSSVTLGSFFSIHATMSDSGGSGLNRIELWRAPDSGGSPGTWTPITSNTLSGNGPTTSSFTDAPSTTGVYWYGIHVFDGAGNQANEPGGPVSRAVSASTETISAPTLNGLTQGYTNTSYTYSTSGAASSVGHTLQYYFDWGDGTNSGWISSTSASHSWSSGATYTARSRARCATHTSVISAWSNTVNVVIAPPSSCTYSLGIPGESFGSGPGAGSVLVTTGAGCGWMATSNASWITVTNGSNRIGTGLLDYTWTANTGLARSGTITIAGQTFTVNQAGAQLSGPDLVVSSLTAPNTAIAGAQINVSAIVANQGTAAAGALRLEFYFSSTPTISTNSVDTGWGCDFGGLGAASSTTCSGPVAVPASLGSGTWYLGAIIDPSNQIPEVNESNNSRAADSGPVSVGGTSSTRGDFDVNGKPDLLWQNDSTRQVALWYLGGSQGNQFQSFAWLANPGMPGWFIAAIADLDGSGQPDLIWQNDITRQVVVWYMGGSKGNAYQSYAWLQSSNMPGWTLAGAADLDGNGKPDLIWQNDSTRQVAVWYMGGAQGNQFQSFAWLQGVNSPGWTAVGMADLDSNGKPDLIWQNDTTRQVVAWYMAGANGAQYQGFSWLQNSNTPGWKVIGITDLDGNGKPDLLWQEESTRKVAVWYMTGAQGNQFQSFAWLESNGIPGWRALAAR